MQPNLSDILSHVPEDLRKLIVRKTFLPGEFIVRKGENAKRVYIMLKGSTRVSNEFVSGQRYTFATLKAGQVIGDLEVLAHQPVYSATNEAITSCDVLAMSDDTFIRWFREDSDFAFIVAEQLAAKMYPTSDENGRIKFQPSLERLYQYLLKRLGNVQTDLFILHTSRRHRHERQDRQPWRREAQRARPHPPRPRQDHHGQRTAETAPGSLGAHGIK